MTNAEYFWSSTDDNLDPGDGSTLSVGIDGEMGLYLYRDIPQLSSFDFTTDNPTRVCVSFWVKMSKMSWNKNSFYHYFVGVRETAAGKSKSYIEQANHTDNPGIPRWSMRHTSIVGNSSSIGPATRNSLIDTTAWYHVCVEIDIDPADQDPNVNGSTRPDACKLYINGVDCTMTDSEGGQATASWVYWAGSSYSACRYEIGRGQNTSANLGSFYMNDLHVMHGINGTAEGDKVGRHTDFGRFNDAGVWVPKKITDHSAFTYGEQGFHLDFMDPLDPGKDVSGNDNHFTVSDAGMVEPTNWNYSGREDCPTNNMPTPAAYYMSMFSANWTSKIRHYKQHNAHAIQSWQSQRSSKTASSCQYTDVLPKTGKYWVAGFAGNKSNKNKFSGYYIGQSSYTAGRNHNDFNPVNNFTAYMVKTSSSNHILLSRENVLVNIYFPESAECGGGDNDHRATMILAYDGDTRNVWVGWVPYSPLFLPEKWTGDPYWIGGDDTVSGVDGNADPVAGVNPTFTLDPDETYCPRHLIAITYQQQNSNSDQASKVFVVNGNRGGGNETSYVTPPTGYNRLSDETIERISPIADPSEHFDVVTTTAGSGEWIYEKVKARMTNGMYWMNQYADGSPFYVVDSSNPNPDWGLSFSSERAVDMATQEAGMRDTDAAAWCWKFPATGVTNNDGTVESEVYVNDVAGWSMARFTAADAPSGSTIGHGLGRTPSLVMTMDETDDLVAYASKNQIAVLSAYDQIDRHASMGTNTTYTDGSTFNKTLPTSSVVTVGSYWNTNSNAAPTQRLYSFTNVDGFSRYGCYFVTQVSSDSGMFVYCGFEPEFVLIKSHNSNDHWRLFDARLCGNPTRNITPEENMSPIAQAFSPSRDSGLWTTPATIHRTQNGFWAANGDNPTTRMNTGFFYMAFAKEPPFPNGTRRAHL